MIWLEYFVKIYTSAILWLPLLLWLSDCWKHRNGEVRRDWRGEAFARMYGTPAKPIIEIEGIAEQPMQRLEHHTNATHAAAEQP